MKNSEVYLSEIKEIRQMMEQSSRFLSLSGLSGVLIGVYALVGAFVAHRIFNFQPTKVYLDYDFSDLMLKLTLLGTAILVLSLITVFWLTYRRAKKTGKKIWNPGSRLMSINLAIPLVSGGVIILIFLSRGVYQDISSFSLIFYGLALVNAAKFTRQEIFYMGLLQIALGVFAVLLPALGLLFWAIGFGLVHIIYGSVMYFRYERDPKS